MNLLRISKKQIIIVAGILVLFLLLMDLNNRLTEMNNLVNHRDEISTEVANYQQTASFLETQNAYATSPAAVEDFARNYGRMVKEGEVLLVPVPQGTADPALIDVEPTPTPIPYSNSQIWWALFFGD